MAFEAIETQEQFDAAISERLRRERETVSKKFGDYDEVKQKNADYEKQISEMMKAAQESAEKYAGYDKQLSELQGKLKRYETDSVKTRIAAEMGIPYELAGRLSGDTEDDIRKDAEAFSKFVSKKSAPPLKSSDNAGTDSKTAALKAFTAKLTGNE